VCHAYVQLSSSYYERNLAKTNEWPLALTTRTYVEFEVRVVLLYSRVECNFRGKRARIGHEPYPHIRRFQISDFFYVDETKR
jgi:hypothetical protein